jgi:3',5'-cyclic-AMP phosphodiesterase
MWIAQISDPHVRPAGILYKGVLDTNAALAAAVAQINALDPSPDLVVLTGDVVDEGHPDEYAAARALLTELKPKLLAIPGNHDDPNGFRAAFPGHFPSDGPLHVTCGDAGPVRVIGFDVTVPGLHHGEVNDRGAAWLQRTLAAEPERPTVVLMHQPPVVSGIPYLDKYNCRGADRLAAIVASFPALERILCGHVHRTMQMRFAGTLLCTAPSTGTAIALRPTRAAMPASFLEPPGFLLHHWQPGAGILTHLVPIGQFPGPFPFA